MSRRLFLVAFFVVVAALPVYAQAPVSWETLAQVRLVREGATFIPRFEAGVQRLSGQRVRVQGFMLPLDQSGAQSHFVLSANPVANCFYCMPGGPESMIEIRAARTMEFSYDPITLVGTLELLQDDPMGMYYRLKDATVAN